MRVDGRNLDRQTLQVRFLQSAQVSIHALGGSLFSQQGLAQEIYIHTHTGSLSITQVLGKNFFLGRENYIGRLPPHTFLDYRHRHAWQPRSK